MEGDRGAGRSPAASADHARHAWACFVARSPPIAPSAAPPTIRASIWGMERKTARVQPERHGEQGLEPGRGQREGNLQNGQRQRARDQPLDHALQEAGHPDHALCRAHQPHDLHLVAAEVQHERGRRRDGQDGRQREHGADTQPHELKEPLELGQSLDP